MSGCLLASNSLTGGRQCDDCDETANKLLWCEKCGVALCFECDSHCHHGRSLRRSHLRILLPSVVTPSAAPAGLITGQTKSGSQHRSRLDQADTDLTLKTLKEHGAAPHSPSEAWGAGSSSRFSIDGREMRVSWNKNFELQTPPHSPFEDKRKRKKKKGKGSPTASSPTETSEFVLSSGEMVQKEEGAKVMPSVISFIKVAAASSGCSISGQGEGSMQESDTSNLSLSASPEIESPIYTSSTSLLTRLQPKQSAMRGGSEGTGLGPRPKLHVKWHPDVLDPVCTSVSHTVRHNRMPIFFSRRSYQKHLRHKSKASSDTQTSRKKQGGTHKSKKSNKVPNSRSDVSLGSQQIIEGSSFNEEESLRAPPPSPDGELPEDLWLPNCTDMPREGMKNCEQSAERESSDCCANESRGTDHLPENRSLVDEIVDQSCIDSKGKLMVEDVKDIAAEKPPNTSVQEKPSGCPRELQLGVSCKPKPSFVHTEQKNFLTSWGVEVTGAMRETLEVFTNSLHQSGGEREIIDEVEKPIEEDTQIDESMAVGLPESCQKAVACMLHATKMAAQGDSLGAMVEYEAAARIFREAEKYALNDASPAADEVAREAVRGQVTAWISVAALYSQKGQICQAEKCHLLVLRVCQSSGLKLDAGKCLLEAGKCQLRREECKRAQALFSAATLLFKDCGTEEQDCVEGEVTGEADSMALQELVLKASRLAGAAALQGHDMEVGKKLLLGALVTARRLHFKAEEARCLRLLAKLQKGEPYLKSLQAAVESLSVCDLPYEHAEALFCLASLKTTLHLNVLPDTQADSGPQKVESQGFLINSAKYDLEAAANLLEAQTNLANGKSRVVSLPLSRDVKEDMESQSEGSSPCIPPSEGMVHSRRPRVKLLAEECGPLRNTPGVLELLGRIHEASARICVLLGEVMEAWTYLSLALKNKEWVSACKADSSHAEELLGRLQWQNSGSCRKSWRVLGGSLIGV